MTDLSDFKDLYVKTAKENTQVLKEGLAALSKEPHNAEALDQMYRSAHTLKSKSLLMGYTNIGITAKIIEDILYEVKEGKKSISNDLLETFGSTIANLEKELQSL